MSADGHDPVSSVRELKSPATQSHNLAPSIHLTQDLTMCISTLLDLYKNLKAALICSRVLTGSLDGQKLCRYKTVLQTQLPKPSSVDEYHGLVYPQPSQQTVVNNLSYHYGNTSCVYRVLNACGQRLTTS